MGNDEPNLDTFPSDGGGRKKTIETGKILGFGDGFVVL